MLNVIIKIVIHLNVFSLINEEQKFYLRDEKTLLFIANSYKL